MATRKKHTPEQVVRKPATAASSARDPWRCSTRTATMEQSPRSTAASRHRGSPQSPRAPPRQTTRDHGALIMRKLIAWVFMYSLDGLLADEGTEYWRFCFGLPSDPAGL